MSSSRSLFFCLVSNCRSFCRLYRISSIVLFFIYPFSLQFLLSLPFFFLRSALRFSSLFLLYVLLTPSPNLVNLFNFFFNPVSIQLLLSLLFFPFHVLSDFPLRLDCRSFSCLHRMSSTSFFFYPVSLELLWLPRHSLRSALSGSSSFLL